MVLWILPAGIAIGSGIAGWLNKRREAKDLERAGRTAQGQANQGFNYLKGSSIGQDYLPAGGAAAGAQRDLLGIGDDPEAAQRAFEAWQASTGFQGQLETGSRAITGNRAAAGLLGSGSTAKALTRYGQQLGRESFSNYFDQLGTIANRGINAGQIIGGAATQGGVAAAELGMRGAGAAAGARSEGWNELLGGVGGAYDEWEGRGQPAAISAVPAASERAMWSARPRLARPGGAPNYLGPGWTVR